MIQPIYIGEAESIKDRLRNHLSKDFWTHVVFFISKDDNLTKAHIRYLEGRLIDQAKLAARVEVKNGQASGSKLPESDREDMEIFLERIHQLLPVLGVEALLPTGGTEEQRAEEEELVCEIKGLRADGRLTPSGLVVLANSQAVLNERASASQYPNTTKERNELIDTGVLIRHEDHYSFSKDIEFNSPSAAAAVIHGGSANGLTAWKNSRGQTLKELEEEEIGP